ncbi:MAG: ATP-dependent zinc metalloprotease FtsH 3 [Mycoplasmataceae bacterium]|nr:MAG: ATP-dependent zinc metalloprotease FtsH 3 [Mycoplasmataceae bacterium]
MKKEEKNNNSDLKNFLNKIKKNIYENKKYIVLVFIILLFLFLSFYNNSINFSPLNYINNIQNSLLELAGWFEKRSSDNFFISINVDKKPSFWSSFFVNIYNFLKIVFLLLLINSFLEENKIFSFIFSKKKTLKEKITFSQIGGLYEAKEELREIIDFFNNPEIFTKRGAKIPKGIMLVGPPGNGKTLLAKALSNECGVHFIFKSASEFEQALVGVGAMRVRKLFEEAREYPEGCIIFIDEIDSIGIKRYSSMNRSGEQSLNQLLSEMDGFVSNDKILILAATNEMDVLDKALLRPGRFDRKIYISNPDFNSRKEIIKINSIGKLFDYNVDLDEIASMTRGFSGAEITNLINESLIISIRNKKDSIDQDSLIESLDRVVMGPSLKSQTPSVLSQKITAYHESGHAVVALTLPETIVKKITITARWNAGGYTWVDLYNNDRDDDYFLNKKQILANIMSLMGGRISEELIFGIDNVTNGAYSDTRKINNLLDDLIIDYSMSDIGIVSNDYSKKNSNVYSQISQNFSDNYRKRIEHEREKIVKDCQNKVKKILRDKVEILDLFAKILLEKNTIQKDDIIYIFVNKTSPYSKLLK